MAYTNSGAHAAHNFEAGVWAVGGAMAFNAARAVRAKRDEIDAQRLADHAALARANATATRLLAENAIELLARERENCADLLAQLLAAKVEAAKAAEFEDANAKLRRELRLARAN